MYWKSFYYKNALQIILLLKYIADLVVLQQSIWSFREEISKLFPIINIDTTFKLTLLRDNLYFK